VKANGPASYEGRQLAISLSVPGAKERLGGHAVLAFVPGALRHVQSREA
jgi:hypothetical protein